MDDADDVALMQIAVLQQNLLKEMWRRLAKEKKTRKPKRY